MKKVKHEKNNLSPPHKPGSCWVRFWTWHLASECTFVPYAMQEVETSGHRHSVLNSGAFTLLWDFICCLLRISQNWFLASGQSRPWMSPAHPLTFHLECVHCSPATPTVPSPPHRGGNERQLGNWLILVSKIFGRGDSWKWVVKWRLGKIWRFQLSIHYFSTGGPRCNGLQGYRL